MLLVVSTLVLIVSESYARLPRLLENASRSNRYHAATPEELMQCRELFVRSVTEPTDPTLAMDWRALGFEFEQLPGTEMPCWVVYEQRKHARGWGLYMICPERIITTEAAPALVLQAPHSFADRFTRNVALRLVDDGHFAAAAWNTVHRRVVDVAHTADHPFHAFTQAMLDVRLDSYVVQVHGFDPSNRTTSAGSSADLIVSNGDDFPEAWVRKAAVMLQSEPTMGRVHLYPTQVRELGATTNVQGLLLRQAGSQRFLHLEMSHDLRVRMVADPRVRAALLKNLAASVE
jgi:hypothetical protein